MEAKRLVVCGRHECRVEAFDLAERPGPDGYLMRVAASLVSPGTELLMYRSGGAVDPPRPTGYIAVGTIVAAGADAEAAWVGKTAYLFPADDRQCECHASHRTVGRDALLVELPAGLSPEAACFARMINISLSPFAHAGQRSLDTVLVVGLGLVGQMAAQVARIRGCRTIGVDPDARRRERAMEAGLDVCIDPGDGDIVDAVKSAGGGRGADLTINVTGRTDTFPLSVAATADGGEVCNVGAARQQDETRAYDMLHDVFQRHITIRGGWEMRLPRRASAAGGGASTEQHLRLALRWLAEGRLNLGPVWTHTIEPDALPGAFAALDGMDPDYLGVVAKWT